MSHLIGVLIVDDNEQVRFSLKVMIETLNDVVVVGEAENGQLALELCGALQPDVVLMDLVMPVMDGVTATQFIHQRYPHLPIFILTTTVDYSLIEAALCAGARGYIPKTASIDVIIAALYQKPVSSN